MIQGLSESSLAVILVVVQRGKSDAFDHLMQDLRAPPMPGVEITRQQNRAQVLIDDRQRASNLFPKVTGAQREVNSVYVDDQQCLIGVRQSVFSDHCGFWGAKPRFNTDEITFAVKEANRPGVIKIGDDFTYVVMPVNLTTG